MTDPKKNGKAPADTLKEPILEQPLKESNSFLLLRDPNDTPVIYTLIGTPPGSITVRTIVIGMLTIGSSGFDYFLGINVSEFLE